MAITATDIHFRGSITTGTAGNQSAFGGAGTSLGKYITNNDLTDATLNNLFPDATGDENAASNVDYQLVFIYNAHGTLTWQSVFAWLSAEVAGGTSAAIGVDTTAASALGSASAQGLTIANKNTAPAGVSFTSPTTKGAGVSVGNIAAGNVRGLWVRRTAANTAAVDNDGATIRAEGDTAA
jgi:hypothetical protein